MVAGKIYLDGKPFEVCCKFMNVCIYLINAKKQNNVLDFYQ